jgi:NADH dehydrogenase
VQFESRILVLIQWAWHFTTRNRSARLITGDETMHPDNKHHPAVNRSQKCAAANDIRTHHLT